MIYYRFRSIRHVLSGTDMSFFLAFFFLLSHNNPTVAAPPAAPGPSLDRLFVGAPTLVHTALAPSTVVPRPCTSRPACPAHRAERGCPHVLGSSGARPSLRRDRARLFSPVQPSPDHVGTDHSCPPCTTSPPRLGEPGRAWPPRGTCSRGQPKRRGRKTQDKQQKRMVSVGESSYLNF